MSEPTARAAGGAWRERPHHSVMRVGSSGFEQTPCYCWAPSDHRVGEEQNLAAAVPSPETAPTEGLTERSRFRRGPNDGFHVGYGDWVNHASYVALTSALEYGDDTSSPTASPMELLPALESLARDAAEWREHEQWRNDCAQAGHSQCEDCDVHRPHCCNGLVTLDAALDWVAEQFMAFDPLNHAAHAALAALRDRAAPRAPQPDTTHDTEEA